MTHLHAAGQGSVPRGVAARTTAAACAPQLDAFLCRAGMIAVRFLRLTRRLAVFCLLAMLAIAVVPIAVVAGGWGGLLWFAGAYRVISGISRRRRGQPLVAPPPSALRQTWEKR